MKGRRAPSLRCIACGQDEPAPVQPFTARYGLRLVIHQRCALLAERSPKHRSEIRKHVAEVIAWRLRDRGAALLAKVTGSSKGAS